MQLDIHPMNRIDSYNPGGVHEGIDGSPLRIRYVFMTVRNPTSRKYISQKYRIRNVLLLLLLLLSGLMHCPMWACDTIPEY